MAVKNSKVKAKRPHDKVAPPGPRPAVSDAAERLSGWAAIATVASWVLVLLGERVLETKDFAPLLTGLGVLGLVACLAQRVWAFKDATAERRPAALAFTVLSAIGLLAFGLYYATTEAGRDSFGLPEEKLGEPDPFGDVATVAWITLMMASLLPTVLGELARRSMARAERVESRRILAAVVGGVALALAAVYGSLFTYTAGKLEVMADFSFFRVAAPSESTKRMIDSLEEPLKVLVFFPDTSEVGTKVGRYLEELRSRTDKLEVESHDRLLSPDLAKEYNVRKDGVLVLVRDKKHETLDIGVEDAVAASKLRKLDGEFQKVLLQAMREKRNVYLTVGHGELNESTDKKAGKTVRLARQLIESQNYGIKDLGLAEGLGNEVPDDAWVVLILGPTEPFSEREVETLRDYLERGGHLFMALDADAKVDLAPLAALAGISWEPNLVVNDQILYRMERTDADKKILVAKRFSSHASVSTLSKLAARGAAVLIPGSAPLDKLEDGDKALKIDFAVKSVPGSYVDADGSWSFDSDTEKKGTYNLLAAVSKKIGDAEGAEGEARAIVMGDAEAFTDPVMDFAKTNRLLFIEAIRWLGGEESFSGEITSEEDVRIVHTKEEDQVWFYTTILGVPSLVLGAGLLLSRGTRRRKPAAGARAGKSGKGAGDGGPSKRRAPAGRKAAAATADEEPGEDDAGAADDDDAGADDAGGEDDADDADDEDDANDDGDEDDGDEDDEEKAK